MAEEVISSIEAKVGHPDGEILSSGEKIVYDYDKDGQFIGFHKEAVK